MDSPSVSRPRSRQLLRASILALPLLLLLLDPASAQRTQLPPPPPAPQQHAEYRSIDGWGNNLEHPEWGAANTPFVRLQVGSGYTNSSSALTGTDRPGPREISLKLMGTNYPDKRRYLETNTSDMLTYMGQFFDHDFDKTQDGNGTEMAPIRIPKGDPFYDPTGTGNKTMPFKRSAYAQPNASSVRSPINLITAFIDGSLVYGSSDDVSRALRSGVGGLLRVANDSGGAAANGLPMLPLVQAVNISTNYMANDANRLPPGALRAAGDVRGNVDPPVLAFQTLWVREHNRLASELAKQRPQWDDETLFQEARKWNIAFLQRVCFSEYIPALGLFLPPYNGYNASVNPSIDVFFSTVSYRYGHSEVTDIILRIDDQGNEVPQGHLLLSQAYFNPTISLSAGIEPVLRGLAMRVQGYVEPRFSTAVQNFLFGLPGVNGTDLFARNIQRGRDHGIPDYNTCRRNLGLKPITSFGNLTDDPTLVKALTELYGTPDKCDAYVCGLAEKKLPNSHFGELFAKSLTDQYTRVRDGDWYYWENNQTGAFNETEMAEIKNTTIRDIILRNTDIKVLPTDLWRVDSEQPWPQTQAAVAQAGGAAPTTAEGAGPPQSGQQVSLANGQYKLGWTFPPGTDKVEFTIVVQGSGWVGLGVPADATSAMVNADIVMARVLPNGTALVDDMWATAFAPPQRDTALGGTSDVELVSASEANGVTSVTFRRPLAATDPHDRAIVPDASNTLIYAWNPDTEDITQYHGIDHRGIANVQLLSGGSAQQAVVEELEGSGGFRTLRTHGILMIVVFAMLLPLAAIANRAKNTAFLMSKPAVKQALFYMHIILNVAAVALAAAALGLVFARLKNLDFIEVPFSHGQLGVAVASLLFVQALYPWLRPKPVPLTAVRRVWELVHTTLGRAIIILGLVNMALGIHIITSEFGGDLFFFAAMASIPIGALVLLASVMDRLSWQSSQRTLQNEHVITATGEERQSSGELPIREGKTVAAP